MSIEGKHVYRFTYLKSEQWGNVRIAALARERAKCQICGDESLSNDAHHIWYPENIWETTAAHLVILCRPCHDFIHCMLPECKTNDEELGRAQWLKFANAIIVWRKTKGELFTEQNTVALLSKLELHKIGAQIPVQTLRAELVRLKEKIADLEAGGVKTPPKEEPEHKTVFKILGRWYQAYQQSEVKKKVALKAK